jgi:hypothetical protein
MLVERQSNSLRLRARSAVIKQACIETNVKTVCCAIVLSREPSIRINTACRKLNTVTETTNIRESNGTNLKPIAPILFFNEFLKITEY